MDDFISLKIPAKPEYASALRLTVAAVANRVGLSIDDIEDIKIAVSEAFNKLMLSKEVSIQIQLLDERIEFCLEGDNPVAVDKEDMGNLILSTLMDDVIWDDKKIYLTKQYKG